MPKCYQLVGVPGSGKSTWIKGQIWALGLTVVSTDLHVERQAELEGKTYSEVFEEYMPTAIKQMMVNVNMAAAMQLDIVWDQTSTTIASGPASSMHYLRLQTTSILPWYSVLRIVPNCM